MKFCLHYGAALLTLTFICTLAAFKYKETSQRIPAGKGVIIYHHANPKLAPSEILKKN